MFNEYTDNGGGAFIFRSVADNRKLVDETIGVLLKRAFLSIVTATLPSYRRRGFVLLSFSFSLGSMIIARLKQTIFPDETLARFPALSVSILCISFHTSYENYSRF